MILKGGTEENEIDFELKFMKTLSLNQRFKIMFEKINFLRRLLNEDRKVAEIVKRK